VRFRLANNVADRRLATDIIKRTSTSVEDFFKLWPQDKHYFFDDSKTALLAYRVEAGVALVLDGPSGNKRAYAKLLKDFIAYCQSNAWKMAIIHADDDARALAVKAGCNAIFIGNEALVDVEEFCSATARSKHFRYVENKAVKAGLRVEFWEPPLSVSQVQELRQVSDAWLGTAGRREYGFVMGYFEESYIKSSEVAVLLEGDAVIAYANVIPSYVPGERSIDHMRHTAAMPSIGMHYLLKTMIRTLADKDVKTFNMGLSPLSGLDELTDPNMAERVMVSLKSFGSRYYSFAGLEQFKNKFKPRWQARYIIYQGVPTNLIRVANSLNKATAYPAPRRTGRIITGLSLFAGLAYASFLLAYPLDLNSRGLASDLGSHGAPYAWLFNGLDVAVGAVIIGLSLVGLARLHNWWQRSMAGMFLLGGLGNILAALTPLGSHISFAGYQLSVLGLHALFSAISIAGFLGAAALFVYGDKKYRTVAAALFVILCVISLASVATGPNIDGLLQRVQLSIIGVFIVCIGWRLGHGSN
jgi:hypothetical membrane protein